MGTTILASVALAWFLAPGAGAAVIQSISLEGPIGEGSRWPDSRFLRKSVIAWNCPTPRADDWRRFAQVLSQPSPASRDVISNELQFGPLAITQARCSAGSLHDQILKQWGLIRSYVINERHLLLSLIADGGIYEFEPLKKKP